VPPSQGPHQPVVLPKCFCQLASKREQQEGMQAGAVVYGREFSVCNTAGTAGTAPSQEKGQLLAKLLLALLFLYSHSRNMPRQASDAAVAHFQRQERGSQCM
jgi:hypothetical protein